MIRVHVLTGFLGTGKTTTILDILAQAPKNQRWAVLVNEFGEVGVDGAILAASGVSTGTVIKEVPGGCLCCASGLPFQMTLNMLIAREKPDVLLIEPTGLGHPSNIVDTLKSEQYLAQLTLGASVCLVDARHLRDTRYTNNDIYLDQIAMADVLVANKNDLATEQDRQAFDALVARSQPAKALVLRTEQGKIDWRLIAELVVEDDKATERSVEHADQHSHDDGHAHHHHAHTPNKTEQAPLSLAEGEERRRFSNQGFEHFTVGWLIAGEILFSLDALRHWFDQLENADDTVVGSPLVERAKGIINTDQGWFVVNWREGVLSEMPTRVLADSRLEIITSSEPNAEDLEQSLWRCRLNPT